MAGEDKKGLQYSKKKSVKVASWLVPISFFLIDRIIKNIVLEQNDYVLNTSAALGVIPNNYLVLGLSIIILTILSRSHYQEFKGNRIATLGFVFIFLGALSNIIDRLLYQGVIDYIFIPRITVFNIADVMIVIGCSTLFFHLINNRKEN